MKIFLIITILAASVNLAFAQEKGKVIALSLDQSIRLALSNNKNIEIARDDVRNAKSTLRSLNGTYDPIDQTRRQIKVQCKRVAQSNADFRRQTIETISQVQRTYWDLVFALRDQQNFVSKLNLIKEHYRQIEARIAAGALAPHERAEASIQLFNAESDLLAASKQVSISENALKQLILKDSPASSEWSAAFIPTDSPQFFSRTVSLNDAIKDAITNRPELSRLRLEKEITDIKAKANLATAEYQKSRLAAQTRSQEQTIIAEVKNAVQAGGTWWARVFTAKRARENAEEQLNRERSLYDAGRSTRFLLFLREDALTNARTSEIRALIDYNKAVVDLQKVRSTTFLSNVSPTDDDCN